MLWSDTCDVRKLLLCWPVKVREVVHYVIMLHIHLGKIVMSYSQTAN